MQLPHQEKLQAWGMQTCGSHVLKCCVRVEATLKPHGHRRTEEERKALVTIRCDPVQCCILRFEITVHACDHFRHLQGGRVAHQASMQVKTVHSRL